MKILGAEPSQMVQFVFKNMAANSQNKCLKFCFCHIWIVLKLDSRGVIYEVRLWAYIEELCSY